MKGIPNFADSLCREVLRKNTALCLGLDPQLECMPSHLKCQAVEKHGREFEALGWLFLEFNRRIIDGVHDLVACVKLQMAFYEVYGAYGVNAFERTVAYAKEKQLLVIGDVNRGGVGDTADAYANGYLGFTPFFGAGEDPLELSRTVSPVRVDCVTVNGYNGEDCVKQFVKVVKDQGRGIFVVVKTNSAVEQLVTTSGRPVWQELAMMVDKWGAGTEGAFGFRNVGVVMNTTYPDDAAKMREILPTSIFLIPDFGGQGATADDAVAGFRKDGLGGIVNSSRIIYAWQNKKGKYQCEPEKFVNAARWQAIDARNALIVACQKAGKWPHQPPQINEKEGN